MTLSKLLAVLSSSTQDPYTLSRLNHLSTGYPYTLCKGCPISVQKTLKTRAKKVVPKNGRMYDRTGLSTKCILIKTGFKNLRTGTDAKF